MKSHVLITGGSGLFALNWAMCVRERQTVTLGMHDRQIGLRGASSAPLDLEVVDGLMRAFEAAAPDYVVHTAGLTSVERCESDPRAAKHINVDLASNVAAACARLGLPLVHISTDHLFSGDRPLVTEDQPYEPQNTYGKTKAEAEKRVLDIHPKALVVRTNFYGWGPSYRRSFSDLILHALHEKKRLKLFKDVHYTPILIEIAVEAISELVRRSACGIFNVVGDERVSKYEFGQLLAREFNLPSSIIDAGFLSHQATLVKRPFDMSISNRKVCDFLGKSLGGVAEHIARLREQERDGMAREMQAL